uniref:Immunoglobulin domain-containing protein n=1 Tax=Cyprinus carpio TaxID=7962 RepID=A0A8C2C4W7_CYPCA
MTGLARALQQHIGTQRSFSLVAIGSSSNMRKYTLILGVLLLVDGEFGVDQVKSVLVMKGDSVTLNTALTDKQKDDQILWKFEGSSIARINKETGIFSISGDDVRFKDRLKLDKKTGSLTITNIRPEHCGHYQLDISGENETVKTFIVNVRDDVESVSVMKGDTVTLHTNVTEIQKGDVIQWFGDQGALIADLTC